VAASFTWIRKTFEAWSRPCRRKQYRPKVVLRQPHPVA
jgi:hypothetical protein